MRALAVYECVTCGRIWVRERFNHVGDKGVAPFWPHVGACIEGEPETWTTGCTGDVNQVRPWDAVWAAYALGGLKATTLVSRCSAERKLAATDAAAWRGTAL